jgi:hypothetical protein
MQREGERDEEEEEEEEEERENQLESHSPFQEHAPKTLDLLARPSLLKFVPLHTWGPPWGPNFYI